MNQSETKNKCRFFLHGHYSKKPKAYFKEMYDYASDSEEADVYGQGESLRNFEQQLINLFGQEDCVFLQSGTMAQLIAMRIWCDEKKNNNIAFHPTCHLEIHEHHSYQELHRLNSELVGKKDRLFTLEDLQNIKSQPAAVLFELPQREIGGQLPSWNELCEQVSYLRSKNSVVHCDGARIWECAPYYQKSYKEIASLFDSIYISFYKGIGAVAGAALLGPLNFIEEARIWNRRHGGNLITASPLYISARYNLDLRIGRFESYFKKTLEIAEMLKEIDGLYCVPNKPQVNMFHLMIAGSKDALTKRSIQAAKETGIWGFSTIKESNNPGYCKVEWYVGDAVLDISLEKIKDYLNFILGENI